jgi:hypothetical protein
VKLAIVQPNVWARVERKEQAVRQIDVEGRRDAQLSQHAAVVVAFEVDAIAHLRRKIAARTDFREHGADDEPRDLFPGVHGHSVG